VLTPHPNPYTCGTGKWSRELARQLGVPLGRLNLAFDPASVPLVSARLTEIATLYPSEGVYDLIIHDWDPAKIAWVHRARRLFAVTPELVTFCGASRRPDAALLPCPSSVRAHQGPDPRWWVLLFGMGHKRQRPWLVRLRDLLEREGSYTVYVSTAVHEGSPFDAAMWEAEAEYRDLFGDHVRMLGYLADDALVRELTRVDCCALFFDPAARANNTTLWAALETGCPVLTNLDEQSPAMLWDETINIADVTSLWDAVTRGYAGARVPTWSSVVEALRVA
jgi:hypothetical protein